jgi:hypothetical protein
MSTLQIEVIETTYNGIKYRSRTEARWALFFDKLGWNAEYEPEGYDLDGLWYLPDFYVPEINAFCLIKGNEFNYIEREKARKLGILTQKNIIVLIGTPSPVSMKNMLFLPPASHQEWLASDPRKDNFWYLGNFTGNESGEVYFERLLKGCLYIGEKSSEHSVIEAFNAARTERFGVHE